MALVGDLEDVAIGAIGVVVIIVIVAILLSLGKLPNLLGRLGTWLAAVLKAPAGANFLPKNPGSNPSDGTSSDGGNSFDIQTGIVAGEDY